MPVGAGFILEFNIDTSITIRVLFECILGVGVGFLILGNVMPCHTVIPEEDQAVTQAMSFFCSMAGA